MPSRVCPRCSATLRWVLLESGKHFPVDPVPTPRTGDVAARLVGDRYVSGYIVTQRRPLRAGFTLFDSHYRHCDMRRTPPRTATHALPVPLFEDKESHHG